MPLFFFGLGETFGTFNLWNRKMDLYINRVWKFQRQKAGMNFGLFVILFFLVLKGWYEFLFLKKSSLDMNSRTQNI